MYSSLSPLTSWILIRFPGLQQTAECSLKKCSVCLQSATFRTRGERIAACASLALKLGLWVRESEIISTTFYHGLSPIQLDVSLPFSYLKSQKFKSYQFSLCDVFVRCRQTLCVQCHAFVGREKWRSVHTLNVFSRPDIFSEGFLNSQDKCYDIS